MFRGVLMTAVERRWNKTAAVLGPSLAFALLHVLGRELSFAGILQLLAAGTAVGVLFSLVAYESGTVWCGAAMHAVWNMRNDRRRAARSASGAQTARCAAQRRWTPPLRWRRAAISAWQLPSSSIAVHLRSSAGAGAAEAGAGAACTTLREQRPARACPSAGAWLRAKWQKTTVPAHTAGTALGYLSGAKENTRRSAGMRRASIRPARPAWPGPGLSHR
ncbi:MAG: lysostaphin resistance A-like protein [Ruthenibacterium lactatiformans]